MGSMPRLKIKDEIRYRKGHTNESQNCRYCTHFRNGWYQFVNNPHGPDISEDRCEIIGLKTGSRYRVRPDYTCDRQVLSQKYEAKLDRLRFRFAGKP